MMKLGNLVFGVLALGLVATLAQPADAAPRGHSITRVLAQIDSQIDDLRGIRSPYRKAARIDALQSELRRIERRVEHRRSKRARRAAAEIDGLQARLRRIERRLEHRIHRAERYRSHFRRHGRGGIRWYRR